MAKFVLKDAVITVNGTDLSDHFSEATIEQAAEEVDITGFTTTGFREFTPGLKDATVTLTAFTDFASGSVDAILYPMFRDGTAGTVKIKETTASTVTWTLISKLYSYSPIAGAVGDASTTEVVFRHSGTAGLTRGTN